MIRLTNPNALYLLLGDIEAAVSSSMLACSTVVGTQRLIGWSNPPEDCCGVAVWADNIRMDPSMQLDGFMHAVCTNSWLVDVTIRVSACYIDTDENGSPLSDTTLGALSQDLYALTQCAYFGFYCRWANGSIEDLDGCTPVMVGPLATYSEGGCAGVEFTVTVAIGQ